jgi:hypothetical protein
MIPLWMKIKVRNGAHFGIRLWLPLFLIWPIVLALLLVLLPLLIIAELVLWLARVRISVFRTLWMCGGVVCAMRGLSVKVNSVKENDVVDIYVI